VDALDSVKSWMRFFGWTNDGGPGGEKLSDTNAVIAQHGDIVWIADVEQAIERSERAKIVAEIELR